MPARILVVDDDPQFERLMLQRFRKNLQEGLYNFQFAIDGMAALETLGQNPKFDMVLTDINMPRMDGLALLEQIRATHPLLKVVIVSAYGDMPNIRKALNLGAFDFVTKPINFTDLQRTIEKTLEEAAIMKEVAQTRELAEKNALLQELDQLRTRFFTNISHEFRTPLTIIDGMAEQIGENPGRWLNRGLQLIRRNTGNLLDLVRQILDLNKLESGKLEPHWVQADIVAFLRQLVESFQPLAETRDIQLEFQSVPDPFVMDYDPEKLLRIVSNLLGNALKFCSEGDQIHFEVEQQGASLQVTVRDTGPGIPPEQVPFIFDRFYQVKDTIHPNAPGTGIGLALVQELVKLLGGDISVESSSGAGTTFILKFPIQHEAAVPQNEPEWTEKKRLTVPVLHAEGSTRVEDPELPALLIVEDNPDIVEYLISCLEGRYRIHWAQDGEAGIQQAIETVPDIIISDVMMPHKDGFELCETVKTDPRTSHIPIILLTARADASSRIAGLKRGADAYLAKPFDKQELLVRLESLLELRARLRARYQSLEQFPESGDEDVQQEDQFILQVKDAIHAHMDEEEYGIQEICRTVGISRAQLHRKIKALTGRSTSHFIRYIRLLHGKVLLTRADLNISQVAYECGFRDPKYFSNTFGEEFGESPKEFRKKALDQ